MSKLLKGTAGLLPMPFGLGLIAGGITVSASSAVGLIADDDSYALVRALETGLGFASIIIGLALFRFRPLDRRATRAGAMSMFVASWVAFNTVAIASFLLSGELGSFTEVIFEAVSASTTTGFTTVADPQELSFALRFLRVAMPWATGLGVLLVSLGVLPAAIAGAELLPERPLRGRSKIATTGADALRNTLCLYGLLTLCLAVAFALAGMDLFDALTYALSTASTGGMANHADSLGYFDSDLIEWIAAAGMAAAGGNILVVWWAVKGRFGSVWKSTELRLYVSLLLVGFVAVRFGGSGLSSSDSAVAISSMLSTTGLRSANWAGGAQFPQAVLIVAAGIGAMSGSVGSGFRQARVARIALEVRRSLQNLLTPNRTNIIRIDGVAVRERSLELTYGYLWMHTFTLAGLSVLLFAPGFDLVASLSFTIGIVSNVGVLVDGGNLAQHVNFSGWTELVASFGMLLGRLSIYPVLLTIGGFFRWVGRFKPHQSIGANA